LEIVETGSAAKATLGSGFWISADGYAVTNYHVISKLVHDPDRYRAELFDSVGATRSRPVTVLAVDVVHDLAIVRADHRPAKFFTLAPARVDQGDRLYALGHPKDYGLVIVEGTYNGLLAHALYPKIHFTGALNPGMSGGPTISDAGAVVGVNVSSEGELVSFLVPVDRVIALAQRVLAPGYTPPPTLLAEVARQVREYQNVYLRGMFGDSAPTVTLNKFTLPTKPAPFFKCWADAERDKDSPYEMVNHQCSTDDYMFIAGDQWSGIVEVEHEVYTSKKLNPLRFYSLYEDNFGSGPGFGSVGGLAMATSGDEQVTAFRCSTRNVSHRGRKFRAAFCVRRYKKLEGLYDAVLKAAALGDMDAGVVTTLRLSGVSFENAQRLARLYLERISWRE
jgi:serine protease Do